MPWPQLQALTKTRPPRQHHGISRQGQLQQVNSSRTPNLSPPATRTPCSPPHLQGAALASHTPPTLLPPQTLLLWLQPLVRPTPHHSSHHTQDQAHLSPLQGATPVPSLLLGLQLHPCALTPASPLSLPLNHTRPLANTPLSTPRVAPQPTRLLTTTVATVTQLDQPTPAHSLLLGGLDQDMECHSPTPENPTA